MCAALMHVDISIHFHRITEIRSVLLRFVYGFMINVHTSVHTMGNYHCKEMNGPRPRKTALGTANAHAIIIIAAMLAFMHPLVIVHAYVWLHTPQNRQRSTISLPALDADAALIYIRIICCSTLHYGAVCCERCMCYFVCVCVCVCVRVVCR